MKHPILIFYIIAFLLLIYLIVSIKTFKTQKWRSLSLKTLLVTIIGCFSYIWFVPIHVGWRGETSIAKFRFQVFETELDNYGSPSSLKDALFIYRPSRYGWLYLGTKIGGWKTYFGLKPLPYWDIKYHQQLHIRNTFMHAMITKDKTHIRQNSFPEVKCVDCIYPIESESEIYTVDYLLEKNAFDRYTFLYDEVLVVAERDDNTLMFSFSLQTSGGEKYGQFFEFHRNSNQRYKLKSIFSVP